MSVVYPGTLGGGGNARLFANSKPTISFLGAQMSSNINELELWSREEVKRAMDALKEERNRCLEAASSLTVHWREKGRSIEGETITIPF